MLLGAEINSTGVKALGWTQDVHGSPHPVSIAVREGRFVVTDASGREILLKTPAELLRNPPTTSIIVDDLARVERSAFPAILSSKLSV